MPRKSAASMAVAPAPELRPYAEPPGVLTEFEASVWQKVVATKPGDWFQADTEQLLIAYCRHASTAAVLDEQIGSFSPEWLKSEEGLDRYKKLVTLRDQQSRAINTLSRSMRLTQQSRYDEKTAHRANKRTPKQEQPWAGS